MMMTLVPHFSASLDMIVWLLRPRLCNDWTLDMKTRRLSSGKGVNDADTQLPRASP
jgi:acyl-CoA thioesterase